MKSKFVAVMYHYVRDLGKSRYPEIKGLELAKFREHLKYIKKKYSVITADDLMQAAIDGLIGELPHNSLLLTFDDGYADHFQNVFPLLDEMGLQGSFFIPVKAVYEKKVFMVNKIHFILASVENRRTLIDEIFISLDAYRDEYNLKSNDWYYTHLAKAELYDTAEVIFIKRILQRALPLSLRESITDRLFDKYVSSDEAAFASELYMSADQIKCMARNGMYIGNHSYNHEWLGRLNYDDQVSEIERSLIFLQTIGVNTDRWIMCYPYGDSNESLRKILRERGCVIGLNDRGGPCLGSCDPLLFPRVDANELTEEMNTSITNELPRSRAARYQSRTRENGYPEC